MNAGGWMYAVMALAGLAIPIMAAMNADLGQRVGPATAATALFAVALAVAVGLALLQGGLRFAQIGGAPQSAVIGGGILAFYVLSITILAPKIGVGTAILLVLLGQIASSAVIDHFGLFGAEKTPISGVRALGILLMVLGLFLARRPEV